MVYFWLMEDTRWLRLVTIGLVLAAMAVGYFILAQRFTKSQPQIVETIPFPSPTPTSSVLSVTNSMESPLPSPTGQTTKSAYQRIAERTKGEVQQLPATGFPSLLIGALSASAIIIGFGLRRFPK